MLHVQLCAFRARACSLSYAWPDSQALNHLLTEAVDWKGLTGEIARQADAFWAEMTSALIPDESAFAKKGQASAGVARQWNRLGKVGLKAFFLLIMPGPSGDFAHSRLYLPRKLGRRQAPASARVPKKRVRYAANASAGPG